MRDVTAPWHGREVTWEIDGEQHTASYNPGELTILKVSRERGATRVELEAIHLCKAIIAGTFLVDSEAAA